MDSFSKITSPLVILVVISNPILSLSSPLLRQMFQAIDRSISSRPDEAGPIRFHLVPDFLISLKEDVITAPQSEIFVDNLYNRIPRPVERFMSRPLFSCNDTTRKYFEAPSFTLARSSLPVASLTFQHPPPELDSVDQGTFLHVGYRLSKCRRWLLAACIDERGEGHGTNVWFVGDENDYKQVVSHLWNFTVGFAKRANIVWRVAVAKLGSIEEAELTGKNIHRTSYSTLLTDLFSMEHFPG